MKRLSSKQTFLEGTSWPSGKTFATFFFFFYILGRVLQFHSQFQYNQKTNYTTLQSLEKCYEKPIAQPAIICSNLTIEQGVKYVDI